MINLNDYWININYKPNISQTLGEIKPCYIEQFSSVKPKQQQKCYYLFVIIVFLITGATPCPGHWDPVLCLGGSTGGSAPWEALVLWSCSGGGPLGGSARGLWRGERGHGPVGDRPGQTQGHQDEHARPAASQRHRLLLQSGAHLSKNSGWISFRCLEGTRGVVLDWSSGVFTLWGCSNVCQVKSNAPQVNLVFYFILLFWFVPRSGMKGMGGLIESAEENNKTLKGFIDWKEQMTEDQKHQLTLSERQVSMSF